MNLHVRQSTSGTSPATTQAAEGLPRRKWTLEEVERLSELGFFGGADRERERFELVGGEIVPMSAKGALHENVKSALTRHWIKALPPGLEALTETTLKCGPNDFREPDFVFWPQPVAVHELTPADIRLIVEIADASLAYDLGPKARYYASLGLPDYWVIDARRLVTHIHRDPAGEAWQTMAVASHTSVLTPLLVEALAVRLADLGLAPARDACAAVVQPPSP